MEVATEACPSVCCTKWMGALWSRLWLAWAWRSQCADAGHDSLKRLSATLWTRVNGVEPAAAGPPRPEEDHCSSAACRILHTRSLFPG